MEQIVPAELSLADWFALPEDEPGELVDGHLVEEEVPNYIHEFLVILLGRILADWVLPRGGFVAGSDAKFVVASGRGRKPDLTVYFPGSRPPSDKGAYRRPAGYRDRDRLAHAARRTA